MSSSRFSTCANREQDAILPVVNLPPEVHVMIFESICFPEDDLNEDDCIPTTLISSVDDEPREKEEDFTTFVGKNYIGSPSMSMATITWIFQDSYSKQPSFTVMHIAISQVNLAAGMYLWGRLSGRQSIMAIGRPQASPLIYSLLNELRRVHPLSHLAAALDLCPLPAEAQRS
ncbi:hypothetical protein BDN70DRAFT_928240 [Pholiota conissans]|uniref:Uncharacterized protein n=1 Tax=Pholiota conissans TaxID=109636 RepID=A0A9P6D5I7_9AGAR|nr:hypothetical protein BDN70DRAFT_928240 [Pholiota conissans]